MKELQLMFCHCSRCKKKYKWYFYEPSNFVERCIECDAEKALIIVTIDTVFKAFLRFLFNNYNNERRTKDLNDYIHIINNIIFEKVNDYRHISLTHEAKKLFYEYERNVLDFKTVLNTLLHRIKVRFPFFSDFNFLNR